MIDSQVANWIKLILSVTHLILTKSIKFAHWNWMESVRTIAGLASQVRRINLRAYYTQKISLPLFHPNCYPFRNTDVDCLPLVCFIPMSDRHR